MRGLAMLAGVSVLALVAGAAPVGGSPIEGSRCGCVAHAGSPVLDDRLAKAILDVARNMNGSDRQEVLVALASNPGLGPEVAVELVAIARNLSGEDRKVILMMLARSNRASY